VRQTMNGVQHYEPTGDEVFPGFNLPQAPAPGPNTTS